MRDPRRLKISAIVFALCTSACASRTMRSPEALRAAYADAIKRDDPAAAYALLSPELQARIGPEEFTQRWTRQAEDREAAAADLEALPPAQALPLYRGKTLHPNGAELSWSYASGAYKINAGLPGFADISTPAQALRSFIAAIREADFTALEALLSDDLRARLSDEWQARVDAIEARLEDPGAIELSPDSKQALLRYDKGRTIALTQSPHGWQITSLQ